MIVSKIKYYAELFNGIKEVGNNQGFEHVFFKDLNMTFKELMWTVGCRYGHAWCAYFGELVWKLAYSNIDTTMVERLDKLFSANAVQTWKNFQNTEFRCSRTPSEGSIVIWQMYEDWVGTSRGHEGIVMTGNDTMINTIEGNTNKKGSRDGDQVADKTRIVDFSKKEKGLVPLGFVHPIEI